MKQNNDLDKLYRFKLRRKLEIYIPDQHQTIYTERYPFAYRCANAIYFSNILTDEPKHAFKTSGPKLFFRSIPNVAQAFYAIRRSAKEGFDRVVIAEIGDFDISIRALCEYIP